MREIGFALSRLPSVRALLAGAVIIAAAFAPAANGQVPGSGNGDKTQASDNSATGESAVVALPAVPRAGSAGVSLPRPLPASDAAVLRLIFTLQARGAVPDAAKAMAQLEKPLVLGSLLADRYLGRSYHSTTEELTDWLTRYHDLPDAPAIHALLLTKLPKGATPPPTPSITTLNRSVRANLGREDIDPPRDGLVRDPSFERLVLERAEHGNVSAALRLIGARKRLAPAYAAQLRAQVAQAQFTRNEDADALRIIQATLRRLTPESQPSLAYYVGGLAAWRLDRLDLARALFEGGATAGVTTPRLQAASAFWASRVSRRQHDAAATARWLHVAADQPLTLHGLLARRILRMPTGIVPTGQFLAQADVDAVAATPEGQRAFALLQIGQPAKAEAELRLLWPRATGNAAFAHALLMVVSSAGLADCAAQMAELLQAKDGLRHDELRFPLPRLRPAGGFRIDPALVYALTRLESNFDSAAVSPVGARGLMQIMPTTAQFITGDALYSAGRLHEPATNLELGQRYVTLLAKMDGISNDLMRMLASYNWGPGNFLHWSAELRDDGDPLMFMEAIPVAETRAFVPTALIYSWIYAARLRLQAPSLDALAAGEFPRFTPMTQERTMALLAPDR